jgi:hypothetical protein
VSFNQAESIELALIALVVEHAEVTPVDFEALARRRLHAHESARWRRRPPRLLQVLSQDAVAASIAGRLQPLQNDAAGGARVLLQQLGDERLEGIELAGARTMHGRGHRREKILFDRASAQVEMASDATHRPVLTSRQPVHFMDLVGLQHAFAYRPPPETTPEGCSLQATAAGVSGHSAG